MAAILKRHGYRGVLTYYEAVSDNESLTTQLANASALTDLHILQASPGELVEPQNRYHVTVDVWGAEHYILTGVDRTGMMRRRVARRAHVDNRLTIFETVGFDDDTIHEAIVLAEYASSNPVRRSCIETGVNRHIRPGLLRASNPEVRLGMRRLAMLSSAATVALKRRAQAIAQTT